MISARYVGALKGFTVGVIQDAVYKYNNTNVKYDIEGISVALG